MRVSRRPAAACAAAAAVAVAVSLAAPVQALGATSRTPASARRVPCADPVVDAPVGGEAAVAALGSDLAEAADNVDQTPARYRRLLRSDRTLRVDQCAQTFAVEPALTQGQQAAAAAPAELPLVAQGGLDPSGDAFALSSRPGSRRTIFLDFDGALISGTAWNSTIAARFAPAFTIDSDATSFTTAELDTIRGVWMRVAEDYAPWDVNVTTADPGQPAINRTGPADLVFGTRVLVTSDIDLQDAVCSSACGGISYIGLFDDYVRHDAYQPALVFPAGTTTSAKGIAEAAAHEAGHTLGLNHDGTTSDPKGYFAGQGAWAPIMGVGYSRPVTQWSQGEYAGASNHEQDLDVIERNGVNSVPDDHPDDATTTDQMVYGGLPVAGEITESTEKDAFRFTIPTESESATLAVTPQAQGADLDLSLTISPATNPLAPLPTIDPLVAMTSADRATGLGATMTAPLPPGTYLAVVEGRGYGDPAVDGYSKYASLGRYTISVTGLGGLLTASEQPAPTATAGSPYAFQLAATGGTSDYYTWTVDGLPAGLSVSPAGLISGTPDAAGDLPLHATVTSGDQTATRDLVLHVVAAPAHIVTIEAPPAPPAPTATPSPVPTQTTSPTTPPTTPTPTTTPTTPPPVNPGPSRFTGSLRSAVAALPVRAENGAGYAAARFPLVDADHDCRSTRTEVLQADSRRAVSWTSRTRCAVRSGSWLSLLDRRTARSAAQMTAVWTVPLAEAWQSGARGWPTARRRAYANDLGDTRTLLAVTTRSARARGDREPSAWVPPAASRCAYVADWVAAKLRWGLTADAREKAALGRIAASCSTRVTVTRT